MSYEDLLTKIYNELPQLKGQQIGRASCRERV